MTHAIVRSTGTPRRYVALAGFEVLCAGTLAECNKAATAYDGIPRN